MEAKIIKVKEQYRYILVRDSLEGTPIDLPEDDIIDYEQLEIVNATMQEKLKRFYNDS